jgi:hypothetical protein
LSRALPRAERASNSLAFGGARELPPTTARGDYLSRWAAWRPVRKTTYLAWLFTVVRSARLTAALQISVTVDAVTSVRGMTDPAHPGPGLPRGLPSKSNTQCAVVCARWPSTGGTNSAKVLRRDDCLALGSCAERLTRRTTRVHSIPSKYAIAMLYPPPLAGRYGRPTGMPLCFVLRFSSEATRYIYCA